MTDNEGRIRELYAEARRVFQSGEPAEDNIPRVLEILEFDPCYPGANGLLAMLYIRSEEWQLADERAEAALRIDENDAEAAKCRGIAAMARSEPDLAITFFLRARELTEGSDDYGEALYYLGMPYAQKGEWEAAIEAFEEALEQTDGYYEIEVMKELAYCYYMLCDFDSALSLLAGALQRGGGLSPTLLVCFMVAAAVLGLGEIEELAVELLQEDAPHLLIMSGFSPPPQGLIISSEN